MTYITSIHLGVVCVRDVLVDELENGKPRGVVTVVNVWRPVHVTLISIVISQLQPNSERFEIFCSRIIS